MFKNRPRLLIVGCGDVLARAVPWLARRFRLYGTARTGQAAVRLRALGVRPVAADLDRRTTLRRLGGIADWVVHSAPPAAQGSCDGRTGRLLAALERRAKPGILAQRPRRAVYIGTSGIYGDCHGTWVGECQRPQPGNERARRRAHAEQALRAWARRRAVRLSLLRAPGIYATDRLPLARVARGDVCVLPEEDSYSNHIHADDLARTVCLALFRGRALRAYNVSDDLPLRMGDWFDRVADQAGLPRPPRVSRAMAQQHLSPAMLSYLNESRRLDNGRLGRELRVQLRYPTVDHFLKRTDPQG
ncbi:SDR family NAD(P)-dependent oxidoreductase [Chitiniphilus purpureus]|uniref:SDR family NAD(P)-dependent oxidoreductase n=1 Tax=Chitiniphilus purpureus TaxID=2981137 RepID=A0ABY6DRD6_9NEIS|nr:NAD-dependent epimerase/dehydratase family protein [Chitiniphilus sp. CD1]UXY16788.1 SDR family NAD(P)-dependent oxidoreductase [Chitiniphilus sp. CD1]